MDQWLVRTVENWIAGPYPTDQLLKMIQCGKLNPQDEICPANGYWIYLHDSKEVHRLLGVEVSKAILTEEDEITETQTDAGEDTQDSVPKNISNKIKSESASSLTQMENASQKKAAPSLEGGSLGFFPKVEIVGRIERFSIWRGLAWFLVIVGLLLMVVMFRLLKHE